MSFKRRVLSALGKDVLLEIGRDLGLDVTTRMGVAELRDALAKSKRAKLEAVVRVSLQRDTLKQICDAVGVDIAKDKATLVERILAAGGSNSATRVSERDVIFTNPPAPFLFLQLAWGGAYMDNDAAALRIRAVFEILEHRLPEIELRARRAMRGELYHSDFYSDRSQPSPEELASDIEALLLSRSTVSP